MLIVVTFSLIGIAAVLFFLRFLSAMNSDLNSGVQSARQHPAVRVERIPRRARVRRPAPAITLVCSRSRLVLRPRQVS